MGGTADTLLKLLIREKFRWEWHLYFGHSESWQAQGTLHQVRNETAPCESCTEITSNQKQHTSASDEWQMMGYLFILSPLSLPEIPWLAAGSHDS